MNKISEFLKTIFHKKAGQGRLIKTITHNDLINNIEKQIPLMFKNRNSIKDIRINNVLELDNNKTASILFWYDYKEDGNSTLNVGKGKFLISSKFGLEIFIYGE